MKRRIFLRNSALSAIAVSASGFIRFDGDRFIGDCETTTDILGPFYRPDSPLRNNLRISGDDGQAIELSGFIHHKDCITPYKKAKIELWHCDARGVYDNASAEYKYRGTAYSDEKGSYSFKTVLPVPYDIGNGSVRPAHFHLMISAAGYQPLVTQLYFTGDQNISKDETASLPAAKKRILEVQNGKDGVKKVVYNISMSEVLLPETTALDRLAGVYVDEKDANHKEEFFRRENVLWMKNNVYGENLDYAGNNTFIMPGMPENAGLSFSFELLSSGDVKLNVSYVNEKGERKTQVAMKKK